jgi:IMP cyclohydrolase
MATEKIQNLPIKEVAAINMEALNKNPYPGRGIVMGLNDQGDKAIQIYWVMGRSENSKNRILAQQGDIVRTEPFDQSKVVDPKLIIYTAMRTVDGKHLVSNGDQTDTVAEVIVKGSTFQGGLEERSYEPDRPNFTPRITGEYFSKFESDVPFALSVIRKDPRSYDPMHKIYRYRPENGMGYCIHTYNGDGSPLPSFDSDPYPVILEGSVKEIAETYWKLLNAENKVALVVKGIDVKTGKVEHTIINKLSK